MPDSCCVGECPNVGTHGGVVRYYSIPQVIENKGEEVKRLSSSRRAVWIASIRMKKPDWNPHESSKVCSFHFVSGKTWLWFHSLCLPLDLSVHCVACLSTALILKHQNQRSSEKPNWLVRKCSKMCSFYFVSRKTIWDCSLILLVCRLSVCPYVCLFVLRGLSFSSAGGPKFTKSCNQ